MGLGGGGDDHAFDAGVGEQVGGLRHRTAAECGSEIVGGARAGVRDRDQLRPGHIAREQAGVRRADPPGSDQTDTDGLDEPGCTTGHDDHLSA